MQYVLWEQGDAFVQESFFFAQEVHPVASGCLDPTTLTDRIDNGRHTSILDIEAVSVFILVQEVLWRPLSGMTGPWSAACFLSKFGRMAI